MHCISSKPLNINIMVVENVFVEPVVMPHLEVFRVLKILLEFIYYAFRICIIINKNARAISKVDIWPYKKRSTNNCTLANRRLFFGIQMNSLSIPDVHSIR
jgi:hypothetical protein